MEVPCIPTILRCACVLLVCVSLACVRAQDSLLGLLPRAIRDNFDDLIRTASRTCEALPLEVLLNRTYSYELPYTDFVEYTRTTRKVYRVAIAHEHLAPDNAPDTVIYIPGWFNNPTDESTRAIVKGLLSRHRRVLALDTCPSFCMGYVTSVSSVNPLAHLLYSFIKRLHKNNYPISSIHIIGFSLGAHVAGITGKLVQDKLKVKLGMITALDPAKPCFSRVEKKLSPSDANFVQIIHSNSGVLGLEERLGHVDIYLNGVTGKHPECKDKSISVECDHAQAWKLYSASMKDAAALTARQCATWDELVRETCRGRDTIVGYSISPEVKGIFLYKSKNVDLRDKRQETQQRTVNVFNPFDLIFWPMLSNREKERRINY